MMKLGGLEFHWLTAAPSERDMGKLSHLSGSHYLQWSLAALRLQAYKSGRRGSRHQFYFAMAQGENFQPGVWAAWPLQLPCAEQVYTIPESLLSPLLFPAAGTGAFLLQTSLLLFLLFLWLLREVKASSSAYLSPFWALWSWDCGYINLLGGYVIASMPPSTRKRLEEAGGRNPAGL